MPRAWPTPSFSSSRATHAGSRWPCPSKSPSTATWSSVIKRPCGRWTCEPRRRPRGYQREDAGLVLAAFFVRISGRHPAAELAEHAVDGIKTSKSGKNPARAVRLRPQGRGRADHPALVRLLGWSATSRSAFPFGTSVRGAAGCRTAQSGHFLPKIKSTTQHPRTCSWVARQCDSTSESVQPASSKASARTASWALSKVPSGRDRFS